MRSRAEVDSVNAGEHFAFDVRDKVTGGPPRDDCDLMAGATNRGQCFDELQLAPFVSAGKNLDRSSGWTVFTVRSRLPVLNRDRDGFVELTAPPLTMITVTF